MLDSLEEAKLEDFPLSGPPGARARLSIAAYFMEGMAIVITV
jgi:hypothetical protein